jgi:uncharacterized protein YlxW (UPF0749 family)
MRLKPPENTFLVFLLLIFLGLGFCGQLYYVTHKPRFKKHHYSTAEIIRTGLLSRRLHQVEYINAHLASEIAELNVKTTEFGEDASFTKSQELGRFIGLIPQEGPGLEVVLKDSTRPLLPGESPLSSIIHNTDLVQTVNELRAGGAKAVAINNQRILGLTGIICFGSTISVNGTRIASPFTIQALGDPKAMMAVLQRPASFSKELQKYGIEVSVTPKNVSIPASSQDSAEL